MRQIVRNKPEIVKIGHRSKQDDPIYHVGGIVEHRHSAFKVPPLASQSALLGIQWQRQDDFEKQ